jgi:hypothetical protein
MGGGLRVEGGSIFKTPAFPFPAVSITGADCDRVWLVALGLWVASSVVADFFPLKEGRRRMLASRKTPCTALRIELPIPPLRSFGGDAG